ncbi:hypothetical protein AQUCO_02600060v1 [Aquilegia coerulea]|uniref:Uncharacterized protein n=1 Tax=Aquilegia coerulea TaxID=218851 RepID=A0A2G5D756_AQUCA|nr:hypothetical protein AQUCO_02600060v1 [Aquilegia coerulea]
MIHLHQLQAQMIKLSLDQNTQAMSKLVAFSAISNHGNINYACSILSYINNPTIYMWNLLIRGFSQSKEPHKAFIWYSKMTNSGILPDNFTFPFVLKACSRLFDLKMGFQFQSQIIKLGLFMDIYIGSSLVYLYTSCGEIDLARIVFEGIEIKNVVTWNVMISGCVRNGKFVKEALEYFQEMRAECVEDMFDEFTLVSVSSACANMGALVLGKWVHGLVCKSGFCEVVPLGNALVDMYGKCGNLDDACKLFDQMCVRDIVSWSTMIDVLAMHGFGRRAVEVFIEMERAGIVPDDTAFTSLLCACSHAGLLHEGREWFKRLSCDYGITPKIQHYGCMVDLLGKAGQLKEAYELISEMPIRPDAATWRSMFGACLYHGDFDLAKIAASQLLLFDLGDSAGDTVIMSNLYSKLRKWDDAERMRRGTMKYPGHSITEVNNVMHEFFIRDNFHAQIEDIYLLVNQMAGQIKLFGSV